MAAGAVTWYGRGLLHVVTDTSWANDPVKIVLVDATYTPDQDAHEFYGQITGELSTANGYTAGGVALLSRSVGYDPATNQVRFLADPVQWVAPPGGTLKPRWAVVFKDTGAASTSPLLAWVDLGTGVAVTADALNVAFDRVGGAVRITAS